MLTLAILLGAVWTSTLGRTAGYRTLAGVPVAGALMLGIVPIIGLRFPLGGPLPIWFRLILSGLFFLSLVTAWLLWQQRRAGLALLGFYLLMEALPGGGEAVIATVTDLASFGAFLLVAYRLGFAPGARPAAAGVPSPRPGEDVPPPVEPGGGGF